MTGISRITGNDEIVNREYVQGTLTVTNVQIEAKVGGSRLSGRQMLRIYNASNNAVFIGPTGVTTATGERLEKNQWVNYPVGDQIGVFLISASGSNSVIVSEWA